MQKIYFDNAATTKISNEALETYNDISDRCFGNPSSLHTMGLESEKVIEKSRQIISGIFSGMNIIFTSGGTESNNLAIRGYLNANPRKGRHIVTTISEHPSVYELFVDAKKAGYTVDFVSVDKKGEVNIDEILGLVSEDTSLVSIMSVNNETGYIQDVGNISREIKRKNHSTCFHTDAVQGFCKIPMNFKDSDIDLISVSSHKIHGPKGVGAIAIKAGKSISPFFYGGGQESNIRPGTENVPGIAAFGKAAYDAFENTSNNFEVVSAIKNMFINSFSNDDIDAKIISDLNSSPYIFNIGFANVKSEVVLHHLSSEGIFVSSGSACASKNKKISRVLKAMNVENKYIEGTIRFSFCKENTISEAERTIEVLKKIIPIISQK